MSASDESERSEDTELLMGEGGKLEAFGAVKVRRRDTVRVAVPFFNVVFLAAKLCFCLAMRPTIPN